MRHGQQFDQATALAKVGRKIRTRVEFSGVLTGTTGHDLRADPSPAGYTVGIQWDLPGRTKPLVDWFTKDEYDQYLEEL